MLTSLSIQNVVLIEKLTLSFKDGLNILTGETGAGKSILLDSLGLALGMRGDSSLVRQGCDTAQVSAAFELKNSKPLEVLLEDAGLEATDGLVLRRQLSRSGRSRAFVNDQLVSIGFLKKLGSHLLEVHGQFDRMLEASNHIELLDQYAEATEQRLQTKENFTAWKEASQETENLKAEFQKLRQEEEFLRFQMQELDSACLEADEEEKLTAERTELSQFDKVANCLTKAISALKEPSDIQALIYRAEKELVRLTELTPGKADTALETLRRGSVEITEAIDQLDTLHHSLEYNPRRLEAIDDRLHYLRELARKHQIPVVELHQQFEKIKEQLETLDQFEEQLKLLEAKEQEALQTYEELAKELSQLRVQAAAKLEGSVEKELTPLKLGQAKFVVEVAESPQENWGEKGLNDVEFKVAMNKGQAPTPLMKTASGGERSRLMLALKVVLASRSDTPTIVLDEIDSGVGGAVADAIGKRLQQLAQYLQVFAITHSPQVASYALQHLFVSKTESKGLMRTTVTQLDEGNRVDELARMLSGAEITAEAKEAAVRLIGENIQKVAA